MQIDPNLVYLVLIVGLWLSVTAVYIPGTGVVEVLALIGIAVALFALSTLPTNWWAVVLIVVGVLGFLVMPFFNQRLALLAVGGLVLQTIGSVSLFNGMSVAPPVIVVTIIASLIYHHYALMRILAYHRHSPAMVADQPLVGLHGRVQSVIDPVGTVYVRGETWTARSNRKLDAGAEIAVMEQDGLTLYVEAVKQKRRQEEG